MLDKVTPPSTFCLLPSAFRLLPSAFRLCLLPFSAQEHFLDLCELLNVPKPAAADADGAWYTFGRGVHTSVGGKGKPSAAKLRDAVEKRLVAFGHCIAATAERVTSTTPTTGMASSSCFVTPQRGTWHCCLDPQFVRKKLARG